MLNVIGEFLRNEEEEIIERVCCWCCELHIHREKEADVYWKFLLQKTPNKLSKKKEICFHRFHCWEVECAVLRYFVK